MGKNEQVKTTIMFILSLAFFFVLALATHLIFVFYSAFFICKHIRNYELSKKWLEEQAEKLDLKVCYVNIGGEDNGRGKIS